MNAGTEVKGTIKAHGLVIGQVFNFHGMGKDLPTVEGTPVMLGKVGNKYMMTTVAGEVMTWEFGATATIWASKVAEHAVTGETRTLGNGDTVYMATCEHGYSTGFHTSPEDAEAVALGHGAVSRDLYVAPVTQASEITPIPFSPANPATWGRDNLPEGWAWVEIDAITGEDHLFTPEGVDHSAAMEAARAAAWVKADKLITIPVGTSECACQGIWEARQAGKILPDGGLCCPSDGSVFVHTDTEPSEIVATQSSLVINANADRINTTLDASDIAEGNAQAWAEAGHPRDGQGRPVVPVLVTDRDMRDEVTAYLGASGEEANEVMVAAIVDALQEIHGTVSIDDIDSEAFASVLDWHLSTLNEGRPADPWDLAEPIIWAGTDQVVKMRLPRKMKKARKASVRHFEYVNLLGSRDVRPIDRKRARVLKGAY